MPPRQPCRPDRDAFGPASRPACSPCRHVAAFRSGPARHPRSDPERLSNGPPFHGTPFQRRSPKIGRDAASAPVRESASPDTRIVSAVNTPPKRPESSPAVPAADFCRNPDTGSVGRRPLCQIRTLFLSLEGTPYGMLPHAAPKRSNCTAVVPTAQHLNACPIHCPVCSATKGTA